MHIVCFGCRHPWPSFCPHKMQIPALIQERGPMIFSIMPPCKLPSRAERFKDVPASGAVLYWYLRRGTGHLSIIIIVARPIFLTFRARSHWGMRVSGVSGRPPPDGGPSSFGSFFNHCAPFALNPRRHDFPPFFLTGPDRSPIVAPHGVQRRRPFSPGLKKNSCMNIPSRRP